MGPKKYRPRSIVGQGQLYQKSRILDLLGSHNIFFRTFTPNVRITVHLDICNKTAFLQSFSEELEKMLMTSLLKEVTRVFENTHTTKLQLKETKAEHFII